MRRSIVFACSVGLELLILSVGASSQTSAADKILHIRQMASGSSCATHSWGHNRGVAPKSYIEGVALVFAGAVCHPTRADVPIVSTPPAAHSSSKDALSAYKEQFAMAHMSNAQAGLETARHTYALLIGLGMMESSGKYCEGRDVSQCFTEADNAEAGLFQTSYGAHVHSSALDNIYSSFKSDQTGCLLDVFRGNLSCKITKSHNAACPDENSDIAGTGEGADWQRLTKSCPAFATQYGAVVLRVNGGTKGEFGPIRRKQVELVPECDSMLQRIEAYIVQNQDVCSGL